MEKIAFAGTFDPLTNGHLWVIEEALKIASHVVVMIAVNSTKQPMFDELTRAGMIKAAVGVLPDASRVSVEIIKNEYVAQAALHRFGCDYLIRGIRSAQDFDYETLIQKTNTDILCGAKTLFVMPPRDLESVSSSFVKSLVGPVGWHWHVKKFVPAVVYGYWIEKFIKDTATYFCKDKAVEDFVDHVKVLYKDEKRFYHNLDHVAHCLQELQWLAANTAQLPEDLKNLCIALLGHDSVYMAGKTPKDSTATAQDKSDEELSAELTCSWALAHTLVNKNAAHCIKNLIEKTQHLGKPMRLDSEMEKLMCSMDLAVLGKDPQVYDQYCHAIAQEYAHVEHYNEGRIKALEKLLSLPRLYGSDIYAHHEAPARRNLMRELNALRLKA